MKIKELQDFIKSEHLSENNDIDSLILRLIYNDEIKAFIPLLCAYISNLEAQKEYTKCELIEASSLLHIRKLGVLFEGQDKRELHVINKHSNLSCKEENEKEGYDMVECEKDFIERYNLSKY